MNHAADSTMSQRRHRRTNTSRAIPVVQVRRISALIREPQRIRTDGGADVFPTFGPRSRPLFTVQAECRLVRRTPRSRHTSRTVGDRFAASAAGGQVWGQ